MACRLCLGDSAPYCGMFDFVPEEDAHVRAMLLDVCALDITPDDPYPKDVCFKCFWDLKRAFSFRKRCRAAQDKLKDQKGAVKFDCLKIKSELADDDLPGGTQDFPRLSCEIPPLQKRSIVNTCDVKIKKNPDEAGEPLTIRIKQEAIDPDKLEAPNLSKCERKFACSKCYFASKSEESLAAHAETHAPKKSHACSVCGYSASTVDDLVKHTMVHTASGKRLKCPSCDFECSFKSILDNHMTKHTDAKRYACDHCGYACKWKHTLVNHLAVHESGGGGMFKCDHCAYESHSRSQMASHALLHATRVRYECDRCDFVTVHRYSLINHMRKHADVRKYACRQCDFSTRWKNSLHFHMLKHGEAMNYSCDRCDYRCKLKQSLLSHLRLHNPDSKYFCNMCNFGFGRSQSLRTHMRVKHGPLVLKLKDAIDQV